MPGYGQSEMREGQDVSLGIQNRVLAGLLQLWGVEKPDVLAHDFGGATALRLHYLDKIDFASLLIFDAVAMAPFPSISPGAVLHFTKPEPPSLPAARPAPERHPLLLRQLCRNKHAEETR
jgi:pimeloyl-ACP methyl ester carboxylesterase